jgi:NAD-dependent SIR2 family protein deacetylase
MDIPMRCPKCGKRAFDTTGFHNMNQPLEISLKCPQCNQIVRVPIVQDGSMPSRKGGNSVHIMNK